MPCAEVGEWGSEERRVKSRNGRCSALSFPCASYFRYLFSLFTLIFFLAPLYTGEPKLIARIAVYQFAFVGAVPYACQVGSGDSPAASAAPVPIEISGGLPL